VGGGGVVGGGDSDVEGSGGSRSADFDLDGPGSLDGCVVSLDVGFRGLRVLRGPMVCASVGRPAKSAAGERGERERMGAVDKILVDLESFARTDNVIFRGLHLGQLLCQLMPSAVADGSQLRDIVEVGGWARMVDPRVCFVNQEITRLVLVVDLLGNERAPGVLLRGFLGGHAFGFGKVALHDEAPLVALCVTTVGALRKGRLLLLRGTDGVTRP